MREHNAEYFRNYYVNQAQQKGGNLAAFHGARNQRGYGIGSIFRGLYRWAIPHLYSGIKAVGQRALKEGVGVAQDVLNGEKLGDSVVKRGKKAIGSLTSQNASQKGAGRKATKRKAKAKSVSRASTKRRKTSPAKTTNNSPFNQFFPD
jgi:hypothetical protein